MTDPIAFADLLISHQTFLAYLSDNGKKTIISEDVFKVIGYSLCHVNDVEQMAKLIHPSDLQRYLSFDNLAFHSESYQMHFKLLHANGNYLKVCKKSITIFNNPKGNVQLHILFLLDSQHTAAGEGYLMDYIKYKSLINSVNDVVFQTDVSGNWTFLNNSWERILGYEITQTIGQPLFRYLYPDDIEKNFKLFGLLDEVSQISDSQEIRYINKSGKIVWMEVNAALLKGEDGSIIGASGTLQDITYDKQNRDMLDLLSDNITDLICVLGVDRTYMYVSPSSKATTGYTPEELIGKDPYTFFHPDDVDLIKSNQDQIIATKKDNEYYTTYRFYTKQGIYKWFETSTKAILDENNLQIGLVTSSRVIDQRKEVERLVLQSLKKEQDLNQLKSNFVNLASHEFRTPLACIRSSTELVEILALKAQEEIPSLKRHTKNIFSEVDRLSALIDEVLTVGKIESQTLTCKKEWIDIRLLIKDIIDSVGDIQEDKRKMRFKTNGILRHVSADPLLLNHALKNLVSNAFKYSIGKAEPIVTLSFSATACTIKVKDFGIGIPTNENNKIFQAFFRAENTFGIQGTGLGMFITKKFVELNGGTISFNSVIGKGTEFMVTLN